MRFPSSPVSGEVSSCARAATYETRAGGREGGCTASRCDAPPQLKKDAGERCVYLPSICGERGAAAERESCAADRGREAPPQRERVAPQIGGERRRRRETAWTRERHVHKHTVRRPPIHTHCRICATLKMRGRERHVHSHAHRRFPIHTLQDMRHARSGARSTARSDNARGAAHRG